MKNMKQLFTLVSTLLLLSSSGTYAFNVDENFKGNWKKKFNLPGGNYVIHTPENVNLDDTWYGQEIIIEDSTMDGLHINSLHLKTNSTREEFVAELRRSGLYRG